MLKKSVCWQSASANSRNTFSVVMFFVAKEFVWVDLSKRVWSVNKLLRATVVERNLEVAGLFFTPYDNMLQLLVPIEIMLTIVLLVQIF